ncbi:conserved hypothetical protein [Aeromonas veronii]|uniref:Uncharacterized protein n=1 Tax=Aeromonas veronii TaxID=654 RepID=A0A653KWY4_AERVE|nr:conserved hypothetical protein [Aeromonas veronii]
MRFSVIQQPRFINRGWIGLLSLQQTGTPCSATLAQDTVNQTIGHGLLGGHEVVTIGVTLDGSHVLTGVECQALVQGIFDLQDLLGVDLDIRCLTLEATQRLVDHHAGVRQAETLALGAASKQEGTHGAGLPHADGADIRLDELHGVVDGHTCSHRTTRRVDVNIDVLVRILGLEEQQLGNHQIGHVIFNLTGQEDHPLFQQTGVNIVGTFTLGSLFDHDGDQRIAGRIGHIVIVLVHKALSLK